MVISICLVWVMCIDVIYSPSMTRSGESGTGLGRTKLLAKPPPSGVEKSTMSPAPAGCERGLGFTALSPEMSHLPAVVAFVTGVRPRALLASRPVVSRLSSLLAPGDSQTIFYFGYNSVDHAIFRFGG